MNCMYTVHGILQTRILEWVAFPFSKDLPNTGIKPRSPTLQADSLSAQPAGKPKNTGVSQFSSVSVVSNSLRPHELQHTRPPCPSQTPGVYSNSCPSSWWRHPAISSSVTPFASCHQGLFQWVNSLHEVAKVLEVSASASVLPINTQDWSPLGWTGWISLQSKGLSRIFSNTTVQKHQFFCTQLSL